MTRVREWFGRMGQRLRSRYVRELECEIARLRAENRALLNSLLGTAGVPPLPFEEPQREAGISCARVRGLGANSNAGSARESAAAAAGFRPRAALAPLRRRSWQQIGRRLELEEARQIRVARSNAQRLGLEVRGAEEESNGGAKAAADGDDASRS